MQTLPAAGQGLFQPQKKDLSHRPRRSDKHRRDGMCNEGKMDFIHPLVIADFFVKGLDKLQIVVKDKKSFDFLAVIPDKDKERVVKKIKEELDRILLEKNFINNLVIFFRFFRKPNFLTLKANIFLS